jgi:hypothetical protein
MKSLKFPSLDAEPQSHQPTATLPTPYQFIEKKRVPHPSLVHLGHGSTKKTSPDGLALTCLFVFTVSRNYFNSAYVSLILALVASSIRTL